MKDSYSFDRDPEGLDASYQKHVVAYDRMMDRCGLEWYRVEADVGMMGGSGAHEYMAPCAAGENDVAVAPGYAANVEVASAEPQPVTLEPAARRVPSVVATPGMTTIDAVATELAVPGGRAAEGVPGDRRRRRDEARGRARRPSRQRDQARDRARDRVPPRPSRRGGGAARAARATSARSGAQMPILLDAGVAPTGGYVVGANEPDAHLRGRRARPRLPVRARRRPHGGRRATRSTARAIRIEPAIEVGNIFKLGTRYSQPLGATYLDECGPGAADLDGLLRVRAGAGGGRRGRAVRRRAGDLVAAGDRAVRRRAGHARQARGARSARSPTGCTASCSELGLETLYDDRDAGPGEKFADAELLGCPLRVTVGRRTLAAGRDRGADPARPGVAHRPARRRRRGDAELWRGLP